VILEGVLGGTKLRRGDLFQRSTNSTSGFRVFRPGVMTQIRIGICWLANLSALLGLSQLAGEKNLFVNTICVTIYSSCGLYPPEPQEKVEPAGTGVNSGIFLLRPCQLPSLPPPSKVEEVFRMLCGDARITGVGTRRFPT
jgi:hypothetical protein